MEPSLDWLPPRARLIATVDPADIDARCKEVRRTLSFPIGMGIIWNDPQSLIPERTEMIAEWGLFNGLALSSRKTYTCTTVAMLKWAARRHLTNIWPLTQQVCMWFAADRWDEGLQVQTVRKGFSHLKDFHKNWGYHDWDWTEFGSLVGMMRGWERSVGRKPRDGRKPWLYDYSLRWYSEVKWSPTCAVCCVTPCN